MKRKFFLIILAVVLPFTAGAKDSFTLITNEFSMPELGMDSAARTIKAIESAIKPKKLILKQVKTIEEVDKAIENGEADMCVIGAAIYWRHVKNGLRDIATLTTQEQPDPDKAVGALCVTRQDAPYTELRDLKGKTIGVNSPIGFQGLYCLLKELNDQGFDFKKFFSEIKYYGLDPSPRLKALRQGDIEATTLNVCYYERMLKKGVDVLRGLKVVGAKKDNGSNCLSSTSLYPNWTFLISPRLDSKTIVKVANALYSMPTEPDGQKWTIASDYRAPDELYKTLKMGPYEHLNYWTLTRIWDEFKILICIVLLLISFGLFHYVRISHLIDKRTGQLRSALDTQRRLAKSVQEISKKYETTRRAITVAQLSSIVAHELSQPVSSILLYAQGISYHLKKKSPPDKLENGIEKIVDSAKEVEKFITLVRSYAKPEQNKNIEAIDIREVLQKTIASITETADLNVNNIKLFLPNCPVKVKIPQVEFELAIANLIKNSLEAAQNSPDPAISITMTTKQDKVKLEIEDNGPPLTQEFLNKLKDPLHSTKMSGLGLGLSIVKAIAEKHFGEFELSLTKDGSLKATLEFLVET